jgi:hypothetical protein
MCVVWFVPYTSPGFENWFNKAAAKVTGGPFAHVELELSLTAEQQDVVGGETLRVRSLWGQPVSIVMCSPSEKDWVGVDLGQVETQAAVDYALQMVGTPYSKKCALFSPYTKTSGTCCSILTLAILRKCGVSVKTYGSPNDVYRYLEGI